MMKSVHNDRYRGIIMNNYRGIITDEGAHTHTHTHKKIQTSFFFFYQLKLISDVAFVVPDTIPEQQQANPDIMLSHLSPFAYAYTR